MINNYLNKITNGDSNNIIKDIEDNSIDLIYIDVPCLYSTGGISKETYIKKNLELDKIYY